jgi:hypothetical protein
MEKHVNLSKGRGDVPAQKLVGVLSRVLDESTVHDFLTIPFNFFLKLNFDNQSLTKLYGDV